MCTQKISYFSRRPTNHTPEMDSESVGRFALVTQKEGTLSSILDGTTRTGTGSTTCDSKNCIQFVSVIAAESASQPSSRSSSSYGSIPTCLSRKVCVYGLQVVSTATYEPVTDRITHRRKKEESGTPERSCIIHEPRSVVVMASFAP